MLIRTIYWAAALAAALLLTCPLRAEEPYWTRFRAHNASMAEVQPSWMGPITQTDARLAQALRFSVANWTAGNTRTIDYGNNHGITMVFRRRWQLEVDQPPFFRFHSATRSDGFANVLTQVKYRVASGNAQHGNYAVSAILGNGFGPRAERNGARSATFDPSISAGKLLGHLALITQVGGTLPAARLSQQGRSLNWTMTHQLHVGTHYWFDVENNFHHKFGGPDDGRTQNFITPAAFYMIRRKSWGPSHALYIFDCGEQIATTHFHTRDHNVIAELRILY